MTTWQILSALLSLPVTLQVVKWVYSLASSSARAKAKARDAAAKIKAAEETARAQQLADLHAEIRAHRVTRDAEILSLTVECAKLREDVMAHSETAQRFELANVTLRGHNLRLAEENARLMRERDDSRKITRLSEPPRGGTR